MRKLAHLGARCVSCACAAASASSVMPPSHTGSVFPQATLGYKIAVLVFIRNSRNEHLLLLRAKPPNFGTWSPIGGKLETSIGESPFECAVRETFEETGHSVDASDLHLFAMIAEKAYENASHWLLFLFDCKKPLNALPATMEEGRFGFFSRHEIDELALPETDRAALWGIYDRHHENFVALRVDCSPDRPLLVQMEQITGPKRA